MSYHFFFYSSHGNTYFTSLSGRRVRWTLFGNSGPLSLQLHKSYHQDKHCEKMLRLSTLHTTAQTKHRTNNSPHHATRHHTNLTMQFTDKPPPKPPTAPKRTLHPKQGHRQNYSLYNTLQHSSSARHHTTSHLMPQSMRIESNQAVPASTGADHDHCTHVSSSHYTVGPCLSLSVQIYCFKHDIKRTQNARNIPKGSALRNRYHVQTCRLFSSCMHRSTAH